MRNNGRDEFHGIHLWRALHDLISGSVHPQLEHLECGTLLGKPGREAHHGEGVVDDQLPEACGGPHHLANDIVCGLLGHGGYIEGVSWREEHEQVGYTVSLASTM